MLRQQQAQATLWLVAYQSRQRDAALDRSVSYTGVDAPRLLVLIELARDPGWQSFVQPAADEVPTELPPSWLARLAAITPYRMAIDRGRVAFVSQLQGSALAQMIQAQNTSRPAQQRVRSRNQLFQPPGRYDPSHPIDPESQ